MTAVGYLLVGLFVGLCVAGAGALIWTIVLSMRMTFQFQENDVAYSRVTLWSPMNGMLRPDLLSEAGKRSRRLALRGLLVFGVAYMCAGAFAFAITYLT